MFAGSRRYGSLSYLKIRFHSAEGRWRWVRVVPYNPCTRFVSHSLRRCFFFSFTPAIKRKSHSKILIEEDKMKKKIQAIKRKSYSKIFCHLQYKNHGFFLDDWYACCRLAFVQYCSQFTCFLKGLLQLLKIWCFQSVVVISPFSLLMFAFAGFCSRDRHDAAAVHWLLTCCIHRLLSPTTCWFRQSINCWAAQVPTGILRDMLIPYYRDLFLRCDMCLWRMPSSFFLNVL
jgi:hypothetical protein